MDSSDDEFISRAVNHLGTVKHVKSISSTPRTVAMRINDVDVRVEPDGGADVNDEHQFKALSNRSAKKIPLEASRMKLRTLQNELPVKGEFYTTLKNKTREMIAKVIVIRGHISSPPLICKDSLEELGMLQICEDGSFGKPNRLKIQDTETSGEASSDDSANARGEETRQKSRRVRNDDDRRRAPSSEAGRYSTMRSEGSNESAQNDCAGSVKSTDIHDSKGTQRNIITRNNQVKRKNRRERGENGDLVGSLTV